MIAAVCALGAAASSAAQETAYDRVGRWSITAVFAGSQFGYCAADVDNGNVQFRIGTDGRSWQIGVPYYGNKKRVEGYYGFGAAAEVGNFRAEGDGWASMPITADQLNAFRTLPEFSINLDRGEQTWKLNGAAVAMGKALECARNRGNKPSPPPQQQSAAGGKNCPAPGSVRSQNSNAPVTVNFVNLSKIPLNIMWIDFNGQWKKYHTLAPDSHKIQQTFGTHPWIAVDARGNCHGGVMYGNPKSKDEGDNMFQIWE
ncbi:hypothetical protein V5F49_14775 [Xanthobacter sp. V3C-3]|uniref:VHL beta domain-containing protein n=1 Tax=Xanthobacter lutulentifluminis TaxID=3119935 RepID=UPI0037286D76